MGAEEPLTDATGKATGGKLPVLGIAIGATQTATNAWQAKNFFNRALDTKQSQQQRIAAGRAATIYGRRAIFKAGSTVISQVPVYGTVASLALDGADAVLKMVEGDPNKIQRETDRNSVSKKKSTAAFMREMREKAAKENLRGNQQADSIKPSR
jgi:Zn-dependent metalloprotease